MLAKPLNVSFILEKSDKINIDRIRIGVAKFSSPRRFLFKILVARKKTSSRRKKSRREKKMFLHVLR